MRLRYPCFRRVCRRSGKEDQIRFLRRHVRRRKLFSACKRGARLRSALQQVAALSPEKETPFPAGSGRGNAAAPFSQKLKSWFLGKGNLIL